MKYLTATSSGNPASDTTFTAKYQNIIDYAVTNSYGFPSLLQRKKQNTLCKTWDATGILSDGVCYVFYNEGSKEFGQINWVTPNSNYLTESGAVTWASNTGVKSASNSYYNTGYSGDSRGSFVDVREDGNTGLTPYGAILSGTDRVVQLTTRDIFDRLSVAAHTSTAPNTNAGGVLNDLHFYQLDLTSTNNLAVYTDGALLQNLSVTEITPTPIEVSILARNFNGTRGGFFTRNIGCCRIGPVLGNAVTIHNAWATYVS